MSELDFASVLHRRTSRDYLARALDDKPHCAEIASRFDREYWDGDRRYGYGGMRYDGRWLPVAKALAAHYGLRPGQRVLDIGCGKGFLLKELSEVVDGLTLVGLDVSAYALANATVGARTTLIEGSADSLPFADGSFDLVVSFMTLHNLGLPALWQSLEEIGRVGRGQAYVTVEAYRTQTEKANLLNWQLTCRSFHTPEDWQWIFASTGYAGDWGFLFFE